MSGLAFRVSRDSLGAELRERLARLVRVVFQVTADFQEFQCQDLAVIQDTVGDQVIQDFLGSVDSQEYQDSAVTQENLVIRVIAD